MGFEFVLIPSEDKEIVLEFEVSFALYLRRFPSWKQQQAFLQKNIEGQTAPLQRWVTLADRHVRRDVVLEPFSVTLRPGGRVKIKDPFDNEIEKLLGDERNEVYVWREMDRMSIPRSRFESQATYENYLRTLDRDILLPPARAQLDVRTLKMANGRVRVGVYVVNITHADENYSMGSPINTQRHLYDV